MYVLWVQPTKAATATARADESDGGAEATVDDGAAAESSESNGESNESDGGAEATADDGAADESSVSKGESRS